jgi:hypothetical protein
MLFYKIYSEKDYKKLLLEAGMHIFEQRRNTMCIDLIGKISHPEHKLQDGAVCVLGETF